MLRSTWSLAAVFGLSLLGGTTVAANVTRYADYDRCDGSFSTCAALVENSYGAVGTGQPSRSWLGQKQSVALGAIKAATMDIGGAHASGVGCNNGPSSCIGGPGEPPIVTPEPMTMALVATGLAGMGGIGFVRRRREQRGGMGGWHF